MKKLLFIPMLMLFAGPASAQDVEAMAKWTSYQIVHYKAVGEFSGETILLKGSGQSAVGAMLARVTDRIEIEFDWDQQEFNLVGNPVIRNFPTRLVSIVPVSAANCPAPRLEGALELVTGLSVKADEALRMSGFVTLEVRRDQPGGSYASYSLELAGTAQARCGDLWETSKAVSVTSNMGLMAVPGMFLVMPGAQGGMQVTADKKSIVMPPGQKGASNEGWTWTYTPTGVK